MNKRRQWIRCLAYINETLCSNNIQALKFLLRWISNVVKGVKNQSAVYFKTEQQGAGKSTLWEIIVNRVIGKSLGLICGSDPIKSNFNSILGGKILVVFEELENFSKNEWTVISTRLKRWITSDSITLEKKGIDSYDADNLNNYVAISNNDAIKDEQGRRYFILDVSALHVGDRAYWDDLYATCHNDSFGGCALFIFVRSRHNRLKLARFPIDREQKGCIFEAIGQGARVLERRICLV